MDEAEVARIVSPCGDRLVSARFGFVRQGPGAAHQPPLKDDNRRSADGRSRLFTGQPRRAAGVCIRPPPLLLLHTHDISLGRWSADAIFCERHRCEACATRVPRARSWSRSNLTDAYLRPSGSASSPRLRSVPRRPRANAPSAAFHYRARALQLRPRARPGAALDLRRPSRGRDPSDPPDPGRWWPEARRDRSRRPPRE